MGAPSYSLLGAVERVLNAILVVVLLATARAARLAAHHQATPVIARRADVAIVEAA